jgi:hypothetical protein
MSHLRIAGGIHQPSGEQSPGSGPAGRGQRGTAGQGHDRNKCTLQGQLLGPVYVQLQERPVASESGVVDQGPARAGGGDPRLDPPQVLGAVRSATRTSVVAPCASRTRSASARRRSSRRATAITSLASAVSRSTNAWPSPESAPVIRAHDSAGKGERPDAGRRPIANVMSSPVITATAGIVACPGEHPDKLPLSATRHALHLSGLARHVQDGVDTFCALPQDFDRLCCGRDQEVDLPTVCLFLDFPHHRQGTTSSGADDQPGDTAKECPPLPRAECVHMRCGTSWNQLSCACGSFRGR